MSVSKLLFRFIGFFLILNLALPTPTFALRPGAGLEEPDGPVRAALKKRLASSHGPGVAPLAITPKPVPAGMEESEKIVRFIHTMREAEREDPQSITLENARRLRTLWEDVSLARAAEYVVQKYPLPGTGYTAADFRGFYFALVLSILENPSVPQEARGELSSLAEIARDYFRKDEEAIGEVIRRMDEEDGPAGPTGTGLEEWVDVGTAKVEMWRLLNRLASQGVGNVGTIIEVQPDVVNQPGITVVIRSGGSRAPVSKTYATDLAGIDTFLGEVSRIEQGIRGPEIYLDISTPRGEVSGRVPQIVEARVVYDEAANTLHVALRRRSLTAGAEELSDQDLLEMARVIWNDPARREAIKRMGFGGLSSAQIAVVQNGSRHLTPQDRAVFEHLIYLDQTRIALEQLSASPPPLEGISDSQIGALIYTMGQMVLYFPSMVTPVLVHSLMKLWEQGLVGRWAGSLGGRYGDREMSTEDWIGSFMVLMSRILKSTEVPATARREAQPLAPTVKGYFKPDESVARIVDQYDRPEESGLEEQPRPEQVQILIVEDERPVRNWHVALVKEALEGSSWAGRIDPEQQIHTAADAAEARYVIREKRPSLIFTDWDLGSGDSGLDVAKAAKMQDPSVVVVIISSYPPWERHIGNRRGVSG